MTLELDMQQLFVRKLAKRLEPVARKEPIHGSSDMALSGVSTTASATEKMAAVLVPLIQRKSGWQVLLTRRSEEMPTHAGQISFPGGGKQVDDPGLPETALREFEEETGIGRSAVSLLGQFESWRTYTGFHIVPFVGLVPANVQARPNPREVAEIFEVPLSFVTDLSNFKKESVHWQGRDRTYLAVPWQERYIWGATAGMLHVLAQRLAPLQL